MDVFKLTGTIAIKGAEAVKKDVNDVTQTTEKSQSKISAAFHKIGEAITKSFKSDKVKTFGASLTELTGTVDKQESELQQLKQKYQDLYLTQGKNSSEAKKCASEIKSLSNELATNKTKLSDAQKAADKFDESLDDAGESSKKAEGTIGSAMKGIASAVAIGFAIDKIKDFAVAAITTAAEVKASESQFAQTFVGFEDDARNAISRVSKETGIFETRLNDAGSSIYAFARSNGATVPEAMELMESALMASADSAAWYDKSLDETSETLMSFLKGNFANDAALGVSATEFTRNAKATELFGKEYNDLTEIQKQQTLLKMVTDSQAVTGAVGQAARESDGWANVIDNLKDRWKQFKAKFGLPFLESLIPIIQKVTDEFSKWAEGVDWDAFSEKVEDVFKKVAKTVDFIIDNKATIGTIAGVILGVAAAFAVLNTVLSIQAAIAAANPTTWIVLGIVAAITALIAIIILLVKNWDKVKEVAKKVWDGVKKAWGSAAKWFDEEVITPIVNFFTGLWQSLTDIWNKITTTVSDKFNAVKTSILGVFSSIKTEASRIWNGIKDAITGAIQGAKDTVSGIVDDIIDIFDFEWTLPKLKLPHVSVTGGKAPYGIGGKGSLPKFSVDWYAKAMNSGMILDQPTIFGASESGQLLGAGEVGSETVVGTNSLMGMINGAVKAETNATTNRLDQLIDMLAMYFPQMLNNSTKSVVLDGGALVGQIAPAMNVKFNDMQKANARGR